MKHLKVLLLSSHPKWVEAEISKTCCACVRRVCFSNHYENGKANISRNLATAFTLRRHWNGWIGIFTSCVLALAEFLFFCKLISKSEVVLIALATIPYQQVTIVNYSDNFFQVADHSDGPPEPEASDR